MAVFDLESASSGHLPTRENVIDLLVLAGFMTKDDIVGITGSHRITGGYISYIFIKLKEAVLEVKVARNYLKVEILGVDDYSEIINFSY